MPVDAQIGVVVTHMLHQQRMQGEEQLSRVERRRRGGGGKWPFISEDTTDSYFSITQ